MSEEFEVKAEMQLGSMLSPVPFSVVEDVVTDLTRDGALS